ncbi:unnamed protein product, partial [Discosporangium mesarthrocarpum]
PQRRTLAKTRKSEILDTNHGPECLRRMSVYDSPQQKVFDSPGNRGCPRNQDLNISSNSVWESPFSASGLSAAHQAQLEAALAAIRADNGAELAEMRADLESTKGEREKAEADLAVLKAAVRKERLVWTRERAALTRQTAAANEAAEGAATTEEFMALEQALVAKSEELKKAQKEIAEQQEYASKLNFQLSCVADNEADLQRLMVRVASLEKELAQEHEARLEAEGRAAANARDARVAEKRLAIAREAAGKAEEVANACEQDANKALSEVREARSAQRQAELWLEKSLGEVDAVHAHLSHKHPTQISHGHNDSLSSPHMWGLTPSSSLPKRLSDQDTVRREVGAEGGGGEVTEDVTPCSGLSPTGIAHGGVDMSRGRITAAVVAAAAADRDDPGGGVVPLPLPLSLPAAPALFQTPPEARVGGGQSVTMVSTSAQTDLAGRVWATSASASASTSASASAAAEGWTRGRSRVSTVARSESQRTLSVLMWHSFVLRYETHRREKAEARVEELEKRLASLGAVAVVGDA